MSKKDVTEIPSAIVDAMVVYRTARRQALGNYEQLVVASRAGDTRMITSCEAAREKLVREVRRAEGNMLEMIRSWAG